MRPIDPQEPNNVLDRIKRTSFVFIDRVLRLAHQYQQPVHLILASGVIDVMPDAGLPPGRVE